MNRFFLTVVLGFTWLFSIAVAVVLYDHVRRHREPTREVAFQEPENPLRDVLSESMRQQSEITQAVIELVKQLQDSLKASAPGKNDAHALRDLHLNGHEPPLEGPDAAAVMARIEALQAELVSAREASLRERAAATRRGAKHAEAIDRIETSQSDVERLVGELGAAVESMGGELQNLDERYDTLSANTAPPPNPETADLLEAMNSQLTQLTDELRGLHARILQLEETPRAATPSGPARVAAIEDHRIAVENVPNLTQGQTVWITRGGQQVARATVYRVDANRSLAAARIVEMTEAVQTGDLVSTTAPKTPPPAVPRSPGPPPLPPPQKTKDESQP